MIQRRLSQQVDLVFKVLGNKRLNNHLRNNLGHGLEFHTHEERSYSLPQPTEEGRLTNCGGLQLSDAPM